MDQKSNNKQDIGKVFLQEINAEPHKKDHHKRSLWGTISIPLLAILTGLIIGALLIAATSSSVYADFQESFWSGIKVSFNEIIIAYKALFTGSIGDPVRVVNAQQMLNAPI
mgnify:CR=1 FL=1